MEGEAFSASVPATLTGSGMPQCAVMGWPGPGRTFLVGGLVADGEHEVEVGDVGALELCDLLGAQARDVVAVRLQHLDREGVQFRFGRVPAE